MTSGGWGNAVRAGGRAWTNGPDAHAAAAPEIAVASATSSVRLVLVETRACTLEDYLLPDDVNRTVLIPRSPTEQLSEFAVRAVRRILALERHRETIRLTIMLLTRQFDAAAVTARLLLARTLMTHAASADHRNSRLVLGVHGDQDDEVRNGLMTLVDTLIGEPNGWTLPIYVKFGTNRRFISRGAPRRAVPRLSGRLKHPMLQADNRSSDNRYY